MTLTEYNRALECGIVQFPQVRTRYQLVFRPCSQYGDFVVNAAKRRSELFDSDVIAWAHKREFKEQLGGLRGSIVCERVTV